MNRISTTTIMDLLMCPSCKVPLTNQKEYLQCEQCGSRYLIKNDQVYFVDSKENQYISDPIDKWKYLLKKYSNVYNALIKIVSPVYFNDNLGAFLKQYAISGTVALNIGSGNTQYENMINIDVIPYPNVHIVSDIHKLPIQDASADVIVNTAVLEHIESDVTCIKEIRRVLKKEGILYCLYPFIQGYHASPYDYTRKTHQGIVALFKDFNIITVNTFGGPTSGMLWVFQEWLATVLSFGSSRLHDVLYLLIMVCTFPLKYLDMVFVHYPSGKNIASGFIIIARK